ncbi:MAG: hypothetical protein NC396_08165 [Bacteroides sp.]|nr:hypothetical protein [Bacteroides sp.]MCM1086311.1 hypothetical protein [Bacteroides sp.]
MKEILIQIGVPFATAFLGGFAGWFFKRKRYEIENRGLATTNHRQDITNIDAAIDTWKKVVDNLEEQVARLLEQRQKDSLQISELSREVLNLRNEVMSLQNQLARQNENQEKIKRYEDLLARNGIAG